MEDKTLTCRDCAKPFTFTVGEQQFFATKGLSDPTRCPDCRRARRAQRAAEAGGPAPMGGPPSFDRGPSARPDTAGPGFRPYPRPSMDTGPAVSDRFDRSAKRPRPDFEARSRAALQDKGPAGKRERVRPRDRRREEERLVINWREELDHELDEE